MNKQIFKRIWIKCKKNINEAKFLIDTVKLLESKGKKLFVSEAINELFDNRYENYDYSQNIDLLIVFGWDGSILRACSNLKECYPLILWINMGKLGFLSEIPPKKAINTINNILDWKFKIDQRALIEVTVFRDNKPIIKSNALNEAVISYKDIARLISIIGKIDGKVLAQFRSDWLIIATPTGSTAYNLSAWWPILYPSISAFILTPICSHSFMQKPIVVPDNKTLTFEILDDANLTLDGQNNYNLEIWDLVSIRKSKQTFNFIRMPWEHFYRIIKKKLHWGQGLT